MHSPSMSKGYLHDAKQTEDNFVTSGDPNDLDDWDESRVWYKTGDLVRVLESVRTHADTRVDW